MTHVVIGAGRRATLVVVALPALLIVAVVLVALECPGDGARVGPIVSAFVGCVRVFVVARALAQPRRNETGDIAAPVGPLPVGLVALVTLAGLPGLVTLAGPVVRAGL